MPPRLKELLARANHGWPAIWLQAAGGVLFAFGLLCILRMQPEVFGFGAIIAFTQHFVPDAYLSTVGWACVVVGVLLGTATLPAQRKQIQRFRRDQAMLQRQDWRK